MADTKPSIVFMGSPDFAAVSLKALLEAKYPIRAVITQPDKPKGRGKTMAMTPVKELAETYQIPVLQPISAKDASFSTQLQELNANLFVVIAFGQILPQAVLKIAPHGAINIHASLLPLYRGSAPIQWALINGDTKTGVTILQMDAGVDTGDILLAESCEILPTDTAETLHNRLANIGAGLLLQTLDQLKKGELTRTPQDDSNATYVRMLTKDDGRIDWTKLAWEIDCLIRGVTPWPKAFTFVDQKRVIIHRAAAIDQTHNELPGTVLEASDDTLIIAAGEGALSIQELQPESGKRLNVHAYLCGNPTQAGDRWGEIA